MLSLKKREASTKDISVENERKNEGEKEKESKLIQRKQKE